MNKCFTNNKTKNKPLRNKVVCFYSEKKMNIKSINFLIISFFLVLCSCKKDSTKEIVNQKTNEIKKELEYTIDFPDTLLVNKEYDGVIYYKSVLDTIITTFGDSKTNRYARFILVTSKRPSISYEELKSKVKDTFGALNNREIPFYRIKFNEPGEYYIEGLINDIVLIDTIKDVKDENNMIQLIQNEEIVLHKVIVIEKQLSPKISSF